MQLVTNVTLACITWLETQHELELCQMSNLRNVFIYLQLFDLFLSRLTGTCHKHAPMAWEVQCTKFIWFVEIALFCQSPGQDFFPQVLKNFIISYSCSSGVLCVQWKVKNKPWSCHVHNRKPNHRIKQRPYALMSVGNLQKRLNCIHKPHSHILSKGYTSTIQRHPYQKSTPTWK